MVTNCLPERSTELASFIFQSSFYALSLISMSLQMCRLKNLSKIIQTLIPSNPRRMWIRWACFLVWTNTMVWSRKVRQIRAANTASRSPSWPALILQKHKALYLSLLTTSSHSILSCTGCAAESRNWSQTL